MKDRTPTTEKVYSMERDDLASRIIGRSIRVIEGNTITLDDGTVLELEDEADCCAWFAATIEVIDLTENVITNVVEVATPHDEDDGIQSWSLHILSRHQLLAKVNIEGDPTSGYYCQSVNLIVHRPVSAVAA